MIDYNNLIEGHIGTVHYFIEKTLPMSDAQQQKIVDGDSRAAMYAILQSAALGGQEPIDIQQAFNKSRMDGAKRAEDLRKQRVEKRTHHQIGQKESIEELKQIEKDPDFRGWYNPDIASRLIQWKDEEKKV